MGIPVAYSGGTGGKVTSSRLPEKSKQSDAYKLLSNYDDGTFWNRYVEI